MAAGNESVRRRGSAPARASTTKRSADSADRCAGRAGVAHRASRPPRVGAPARGQASGGRAATGPGRPPPRCRAPGPLARVRVEDEALAVRRPGEAADLERPVGELLRLSPPRRHDVGVIAAVAVADEGHEASVGRGHRLAPRNTRLQNFGSVSRKSTRPSPVAASATTTSRVFPSSATRSRTRRRASIQWGEGPQPGLSGRFTGGPPPTSTTTARAAPWSTRRKRTLVPEYEGALVRASAEARVKTTRRPSGEKAGPEATPPPGSSAPPCHPRGSARRRRLASAARRGSRGSRPARTRPGSRRATEPRRFPPRASARPARPGCGHPRPRSTGPPRARSRGAFRPRSRRGPLRLPPRRR